jgi:hypothetical protein
VSDFIEIDGIEGVVEMLRSAPKAVVAGGFLKGLQAAAKPMEEALDGRVPVESGALKAARVTDITLDSEMRGGSLEIGYGKLGHEATWLEYGHHMVGHRPDKKLLGEVSPKPFMRPAAEASAEAAIDAFSEALMSELQGEVLENVA